MVDVPDDRKAILAERGRLESECHRFLGLSPDEATALADQLHIVLRIVELDGPFWYTSDLRNDRVTAEVQNNRVVSAEVS